MTSVCQDQVQKFNARAEEFHRTHSDGEDAPFQACLLGSAQKDEKIIDQAVQGQCCCSAQTNGGKLMDVGGLKCFEFPYCVCNC